MGLSSSCLPSHCVLMVLILGTAAFAEDWPHWRGPSRDGHSAEVSGWTDGKWPLGDVVWRANIGVGSSSPVVIDGKLYLLGWADGEDHLVCFDARSGEEQWRQSSPAAKFGRVATGDQGLYAGPCSTPEYDAATNALFTLGIDGDLHCWDLANQGRQLWHRNLYDDYHAPQRPRVNRSGRRDYGYTSSPLVQDDVLIVEVGAETGTVMGFDKRTGKELWRSAAHSPAGHTGGPVSLTLSGVPCVAVHNFDGLLVIRIDGGRAGETVAEYPWRTDFANNIATPLVVDDSVILTSSYNIHKVARLKIALDGTIDVLWELEEASKVCSPVLLGDHLYWAWRKVHCVDVRTGKQLWSGGSCGDAGSLIATADQKLIGWVGKGGLLLIENATDSANKLTELASRRLLNQTDAWPHVVLADRHLYCRDGNGELICLPIQ
ncbi:MAG: PQQ-binding-like beta-propeller repeat protein [Planctomycetaceae bacterium]|nr:PQQ-binding-like beta-propeller repeat protein [Planctomycetaceae bacterium]